MYSLSAERYAESTLHLVLRLRGGAGPGALTKYMAQALGKPSFREAWAAGGWKMVSVVLLEARFLRVCGSGAGQAGFRATCAVGGWKMVGGAQ